MAWRRLIGCSVLVVAACGDDGAGGGGGGEADERRQGGTQTVDDRSAGAFAHPLPDLDVAQRESHSFGAGRFGFEWQPPVLGPLFNHTACVACHAGGGRGLSQIGPSTFGSQSLLRISLVAGEPSVPGGPVPVPDLGLQLQDHSVSGPSEGHVTLTWTRTGIDFGDGSTQAMREPRLLVTRTDGSALAAGTQLSYRQAQPVIGLGLLEAVPDAALLALADPDDADGDGISGRANVVWDAVAGESRIGRFGHKANVATLLEQTAAAFVNDIGLTNRMFPEADGMADISSEMLDDTTFFLATTAVPAAAARDAAAQRGREVFDELGCAGCHTPTLVTGPSAIPQLANQTIHPYTDLLLHDVGDRLTDARRDFVATGVEWRTPALWGIGLTQLIAPDATFLHDGRATTLEEAILWHGGEAEGSSEGFRTAERTDRDALIAFLMTL